MNLIINRAHARFARQPWSCNCPATVALRYAGFKDVSVEDGLIFIGADEYKASKRLTTAIRAWEDGAPFRVGTYRIHKITF